MSSGRTETLAWLTTAVCKRLLRGSGNNLLLPTPAARLTSFCPCCVVLCCGRRHQPVASSAQDANGPKPTKPVQRSARKRAALALSLACVVAYHIVDQSMKVQSASFGFLAPDPAVSPAKGPGASAGQPNTVGVEPPKTPPSAADKRPLVSLLVPYYNNDILLTTQLQRWRNYSATVHQLLEVVVVDDGSTRSPALRTSPLTTVCVCARFRHAYPHGILILHH